MEPSGAKKNNREKKKDAGVNAFETSLVEGDNCCHKSIYYDLFFHLHCRLLSKKLLQYTCFAWIEGTETYFRCRCWFFCIHLEKVAGLFLVHEFSGLTISSQRFVK